MPSPRRMRTLARRVVRWGLGVAMRVGWGERAVVKGWALRPKLARVVVLRTRFEELLTRLSDGVLFAFVHPSLRVVVGRFLRVLPICYIESAAVKLIFAILDCEAAANHVFTAAVDAKYIFVRLRVHRAARV